MHRPKNPAILAELFQRFLVRAVVEIGVCFGAGMDVLRHLGGDAFLLVGIDPMTKPIQLIREGLPYARVPTFDHPNTRLISRKSSEAYPEARALLNERGLPGFDVIVVDGDHSFDTAYQDLIRFSHLLTPQGVIYWDDATHNEVVRALKGVPLLRRHFEVFGFGLESDERYDACWIALREGVPPPGFLLERWPARRAVQFLGRHIPQRGLAGGAE